MGYAYGNSEVMPTASSSTSAGEQHRAFTVRSIGPGSYRPAAGNPNGYLDQTGDFKLEANVEYRFAIMGRLGGAVFLDAGNVWLLKADPDRRRGTEVEGAFSTRSPLGTGFGLRYDISYLVIRAPIWASGSIRPIRIPKNGAITTFRNSGTVWASIWPSAIPSNLRTMKTICSPKNSPTTARAEPKPMFICCVIRRIGSRSRFATISPGSNPARIPRRSFGCASTDWRMPPASRRSARASGVDFLAVQYILNVDHPSKVEVFDDYNF